MSFDELRKILSVKYSSMKLSDIARELDVSPQVVSNWKSRNQVPFKYIKKMKEIIRDESSFDVPNEIQGFVPYSHPVNVISKTNSDDKSLSDLISKYFDIIKMYYKYMLIFILSLATITLIYSKYYAETVYESHAVLLPLSQVEKSSGLGGIASQFGIRSVGGTVSSLSSSIMFPHVLRSRSLGHKLIEKRFDTQLYGKNKRFIDIIFKDKSDVEKKYNFNQKRIAVSRALKNIYVSKHRTTGLITLKVEAIEPELSSQLVTSVIDILQEIIKSYMLGESGEKKEFIKSRFKEVINKLNLAEENLKDFRVANRSILSSPKLMLEEARLLREIQVQTEIYITLRTQLEMLNVEQSGKRSTVQILDFPEIPSTPTSPRINLNVLYSLIFSIIMCLLGVFIFDSYKGFYRKV